jgi:hypothetical protein
MINAAHFPGPALWQGAMLMALPLWVYFGLFLEDGRYIKHASIAYGVFGLGLLVAIARSAS